MKISEAHRMLEEMAGGLYCHTQYGMSTSLRGWAEIKDITCEVYISGYDTCSASNFSLALEMMKDQLQMAEIEEDQEEEK